MAILTKNNCESTLASSLSSGSTSVSLASGTGSRFPSPSGGDYFYATLSDGTNLEIVKVTARSSDTLTVVRGQDGTSARAFSAGDKVQMRINAALLGDIQAAGVKKSGDALTGGFTGPAAIDDGAKSSGTYTPSPSGGNWRKITNNGAFTLAAPSASGCYNMTIDITNSSSAGAITFSGFVTDYPKGDDLTTTNTDKFKLHIAKSDIGVTGFIEALQ